MKFQRSDEISFLYKDDTLLVVDKPAGILSVGSKKAPLDVQSRVRRVYPSAQACHRLDKETSGVLMLAVDKTTVAVMRSLFEQHRIRKFYAVLVVGSVRRALGQIKKRVRDCYHRHVRFDGLPVAHTRYWTVSLMQGHTLLIAEPVTGLTHQLRLHFSGMGHPIVGDRIYGRRSCQGAQRLNRLGLHAACVVLRHPRTKKRLVISSPLPEKFKEFLAHCSGGGKALHAYGRALKALVAAS